MHLKRFEEVRHFYFVPYENVQEVKDLVKQDSEIFATSNQRVNEFLTSKNFRYTGIFSTSFYEQKEFDGWLLEVHAMQPVALGMFGL